MRPQKAPEERKNGNCAFSWLCSKALLKVRSCVAQAQPFLEDLWRLQPNGQPLRYLARKFPVAIFLAGGQQLEFVFDLQHGLTQMFKRRGIVLKFFAQTLDLLDQSKRSLERAEGEIFWS